MQFSARMTVGMAWVLALLITACSNPRELGTPSQSITPTTSDLPTAQPTAAGTPVSTAQAVVSVASGERVQVGDLARTDRGWLLVGSLDGHPVVWTSRDGAAWQAEDIGSVGGLSGHATAVTSYGDSWLAVGWASMQIGGRILDRPFVIGGKTGELWVSSESLPLPPEMGGLLTDAVSTPNEIVVVGSLSDGTPSTWRSTDAGASWEEPVALAEPGSSVSALAYSDGRFVAVGERIGLVNSMGVWRSEDGASWTSDESAIPGSLADVTATSSGFVAVGHDGAGSAAVVAVTDAALRSIGAPDLPDLVRVTARGDALVVGTTSAGATPIQVLNGSTWEPVPLNGTDVGAVRAIALFGSVIGVAGDDGSEVRFVRLIFVR